MSNASRTLAGFILGAAAGAAAGYLMNSERKDEIIDNVKEKAEKVKLKAAELKGRIKEKINHAGDRLEEAAS